jgi:hypothetical protein
MQVLTPSIFTLLSSAFCLLVFWLLYELWLHRESFLQANRWYLLLAPVFALLIPHLQWSLELSEKSPSALQRVSELQSLPPELWYLLFPQKEPLFALSIGQIFWSFYLSGLVFFLLRSTWQYAQVYRLLNKGTALKSGQDWTWVENPQATEIASFFHYILVPQKDEIPELILEHELVHMRQGHSWDLLFMEITCALFWFHPLVHRMRKRLRETHEYLADQGVVEGPGQVQGLYQYAQLMVNHSMQQKEPPMLYHPFAAQINQRLRRLVQPHSKQLQVLKYAVCLPLVTCLSLFFSVQYLQALPLSEGNMTLKELTNKIEQTAVLEKTITPSSKLSKVVEQQLKPVADQMPEQPKVKITVNELRIEEGGNTIHLAKPGRSASERPLLILDGVQTPYEKMNTLEPISIESIDVLKVEKAIQAYGDSGKNGVVKIKTKPSVSSLDKGKVVEKNIVIENAETITTKPGSNLGNDQAKVETITFSNGNNEPMTNKPLVIIDGVNKGRMNYGQSGAPISDLNPGDIKKIDIIKGDKAIKQYGKDAEEGVIIITTKHKKE